MDATEEQIVVRERVVQETSAASQWPAAIMVLLALAGSMWLAASVPSDNNARVTTYSEPGAQPVMPAPLPPTPAPIVPN